MSIIQEVSLNEFNFPDWYHMGDLQSPSWQSGVSTQDCAVIEGDYSFVANDVNASTGRTK